MATIKAVHNLETGNVDTFKIAKINGKYYFVKIEYELKPGNYHWVRENENEEWEIARLFIFRGVLCFKWCDGGRRTECDQTLFDPNPIQKI